MLKKLSRGTVALIALLSLVVSTFMGRDALAAVYEFGPAGDGFPLEWNASPASYPHWQKVDDTGACNTSDTDYVYETAANQTEVFAVTARTSTVPSTITAIEVVVCGQEYNPVSNTTTPLQVFYRIDGVSSETKTMNLTSALLNRKVSWTGLSIPYDSASTIFEVGFKLGSSPVDGAKIRHFKVNVTD